jgi:hypothetical protein
VARLRAEAAKVKDTALGEEAPDFLTKVCGFLRPFSAGKLALGGKWPRVVEELLDMHTAADIADSLAVPSHWETRLSEGETEEFLARLSKVVDRDGPEFQSLLSWGLVEKAMQSEGSDRAALEARVAKLKGDWEGMTGLLRCDPSRLAAELMDGCMSMSEDEDEDKDSSEEDTEDKEAVEAAPTPTNIAETHINV